MAAMGSMGSMALLWFDTPSMALKQVLLMLPQDDPVDEGVQGWGAKDK